MEEQKVGELIKERREELNITQKKLAGLLGVANSTISRWEGGQIRDIKRAQIYLLSKYFFPSTIIWSQIWSKTNHFTMPQCFVFGKLHS